MSTIPLMIDLNDKRIIVVGGGKVAERRIHSLLGTSARIQVISPDVTETIHDLHLTGKLIWKKKYFDPEDLGDSFLILIATNNGEVNKQIIESAPKNTLINSAVAAKKGDVHFPIRLQRGKLCIAISTNGASPLLAKKIKEEVSSVYDEKYEGYVDFLYEARQLIKTSDLPSEQKRNLLKMLLSDAIFDPKEQESWIKIFKEKNNL
jgi:precorrin-2 dehydrogenase / sirohydrochlorin ferrochelatase